MAAAEMKKRPEERFKPDQIKDEFGRFDLSTHVYNGRGQLHHTNHYRRHVSGDKAVNERPVGSGNLWDEAGEPAGRVEYIYGANGVITKKTIDPNATHKAYKRAPTVAEAAQAELDGLRQKNAQLEAELATIEKERAAKATPNALSNAQTSKTTVTLPSPTKEAHL